MKIIIYILLGLLLFTCKSKPAFEEKIQNNKPLTEEISKNKRSVVKKYSRIMDEDEFWDIIDRSGKSSFNQEQQSAWLLNYLSELDEETIVAYDYQRIRLMAQSYKSDLWCAAYIINGGCSDDGFEYFRCWIMSKGKKIYYDALKNPDSLIDVVGVGGGPLINEYESFMYIASDAIKTKSNVDIYDMLEDSVLSSVQNYPEIEFTWSEENKESMKKKICPKLFDKYW